MFFDLPRKMYSSLLYPMQALWTHISQPSHWIQFSPSVLLQILQESSCFEASLLRVVGILIWNYLISLVFIQQCLPNHSFFFYKEYLLARQACHPSLQSKNRSFEQVWVQYPDRAPHTNLTHSSNLLIWVPTVLGFALCFFDQTQLLFEDAVPRAFLSLWLSFVQISVCSLTEGFLTTQ